MKQNLHKIFKNIASIEPSPVLAGLILSRIEALQKKRLKRSLMLSYCSLAFSFSAFAWAVLAYGQAFLQSDFWILLRLALSDASLVLKNWNDFLFSLLETFPVVSATIMLIPILALLFSFSVYYKIVRGNNYKLHLT